MGIVKKVPRFTVEITFEVKCDSDPKFNHKTVMSTKNLSKKSMLEAEGAALKFAESLRVMSQ